MAEVIFNAIAKSWKAESAGLEKAERIDPVAKRLLEEEGFCVGDRKPRILGDVSLEDFDLIVTVCDESCVNIPGRNVRRWNIKDPAGKGEGVYKKAVREIKDLTKKLVEELEGTI
jgi:arsenate reductase